MRPSSWITASAFVLSGLFGCGSSHHPPATPDKCSVIPSGYADLCNVNGVSCQTCSSPPSLVGSFSGTGTTVVTSNSLWKVGDSNKFSVSITTQTDSKVGGGFDMDSYHFDVDVSQATILGSGDEFTIFGTDSAVNDDPDASVPANCTVEARAVVTGTLSSSTSPATLSGKVNLQFTNNIRGSGCTQDQITKFPGTGAIFSYSAIEATSVLQ